MLPLEENLDVPKNEVWMQDTKTGNISAKFRFLNTGRGTSAPANIKDLVGILATYNAEKNRGIIHTNEWIQEMKELQIKFDNGELT